VLKHMLRVKESAGVNNPWVNSNSCSSGGPVAALAVAGVYRCCWGRESKSPRCGGRLHCWLWAAGIELLTT